MLCLLIHGRFVPLADAHVEPADALTTLRTAYRRGKKTLFPWRALRSSRARIP